MQNKTVLGLLLNARRSDNRAIESCYEYAALCLIRSTLIVVIHNGLDLILRFRHCGQGD